MNRMSLSSVDTKPQFAVPAKASPKISIIVPVLNEGPRIGPFLDHLRERAASAELILVNATGSQSLSESISELCDRVLTSPRGRAAQMNAGAKAAGGEVLWFVHADCEVPSGCLEEIMNTLQDRQVVGGCFRIRFPRRELIYRVSNAVGNLATKLFGRCYGDRGIFCRREDFTTAGGYPDLRLFEDAEFYRCLRHRGRTRQLSSYIISSARRYEKIGPYRLTVAYWLLSLLYVLRVPISLLARIYDRLCVHKDERVGQSH